MLADSGRSRAQMVVCRGAMPARGGSHGGVFARPNGRAAGRVIAGAGPDRAPSVAHRPAALRGTPTHVHDAALGCDRGDRIRSLARVSFPLNRAARLRDGDDGCRPHAPSVALTSAIRLGQARLARAAAGRAIARLGRRPGALRRRLPGSTTWPCCAVSIPLLHTPATPRDPPATFCLPHSLPCPLPSPTSRRSTRRAAYRRSRPCARSAWSGRGAGRRRCSSATASRCGSAQGHASQEFQTQRERPRPGADASTAVAGARMPDGRRGKGAAGAPDRPGGPERPSPARQLRWPTLRDEAEHHFAAGAQAHTVIAMLRARHAADTARAPEPPHDAALVRRAPLARPAPVAPGPRSIPSEPA